MARIQYILRGDGKNTSHRTNDELIKVDVIIECLGFA